MTVANQVTKLIEFPLTRMRTLNKRLLPASANLSRSALELQIELRKRLLKDIGLVRLRLKDPIGSGKFCASSNLKERRRIVRRGHMGAANINAAARKRMRVVPTISDG